MSGPGADPARPARGRAGAGGGGAPGGREAGAAGGPGAGAAGGREPLPLTATDAQVRAALAARAKMERLLAAPTPFASDDGSADPAVTAALEDTESERHLRLDRLWAALTAGRLIVPVAAHARPGRGAAGRADDSGRAGAPESGTRAEDPAALAVDLPDGRTALPVFTSAAAMTAWRPDVRPVPVDPRRAARLAVLETDRLWILDPGTRDLRLPRPAVVALADGRDWAPSWRNELVQREIAARLGAVEGVAGVAFEPGADVELRIFVRVEVSGAAPAVAVTMEACRRAMADPAWADLVDAVELCPLPG